MEFKTQPLAHQLEALRLSENKREFAWFMGMGTGKTKVALDDMARLYSQGHIRGALVLSNKGSYRNWETDEIPKHLVDSIPRKVIVWNPSHGKALSEEVKKDFPGLVILLMNTETLAHSKGAIVAEIFLRCRRCVMVVDESTMIKNKDAKRTREVIALGKLAAARRIMTGSPVTNSPLDLWAQVSFLNPNLLGFNSYFAFRNYYANMAVKTFGPRAFKTVDGYKNLDQLNASLKPFSFRVKKEECLDLPEKIYQIRDVELTDEQKVAYEQMRKDAVAFFETGAMLTAPLAVTKLLRLHQVVCGHVTDDDGVRHSFKNNRVSALLDILQEADGKVIIWATYVMDLEAIRDAIAKEYGEDSVRLYYGATTPEDRVAACADFQDPSSSVRYFVGNPKTAGYGLTLTEGKTVIYYSNDFNLETREQSEDRAHRIGQKDSVTYVDLIARNTIDEKIVRALRSKKSLAAEVLGDKWREWLSI